MNQTSTSTIKGERSILKTREMQILSRRNRIFGIDHLKRTNSNGQNKTCWNQDMARPKNKERSTIFLRICKFLLEIHWSLCRNCCTITQFNTERSRFQLD